MCHWCTHYGHSCTGDVGKICGRCIHDQEGCITPEGKSIHVALTGLASTDLTVWVPLLEFERQAVAAKEKEWKAREKAKDKVKGIGLSAGPLKVLKTVIHKSSLFSTDVFFGRNLSIHPEGLSARLSAMTTVSRFCLSDPRGLSGRWG
jgi:hypothetical protein